jgi:shikimate dehydrogenase
MVRAAVFGNPISHSLSPSIHQAFAKQFNLPLQYDKILVEHSLKEALECFWAQGGRLANVTAPCKEEAFSLCQNLSMEARIAGSVNTLQWKEGAWWGHNTDGLGFLRALSKQALVLEHKKLLMIGAGGSARGLLGVLQHQPVETIYLFNRTESKAKALSKAFQKVEVIGWDEIHHLSFEGLINTLPSAIQLELPFKLQLKDKAWVFDLNYAQTSPIALALQGKGAKLISGLELLVQQAAESFQWWFELRPDTNLNLPWFKT